MPTCQTHCSHDLTIVSINKLPQAEIGNAIMSYEHIKCDLDGPFMIVTLNRPEKLNAYTGLMGAEITDAFERADTDDNVRAIIVTGAGRAFCAGADVSGGAKSFDTSGTHGAGVFASSGSRSGPADWFVRDFSRANSSATAGELNRRCSVVGYASRFNSQKPLKRCERLCYPIPDAREMLDLDLQRRSVQDRPKPDPIELKLSRFRPAP